MTNEELLQAIAQYGSVAKTALAPRLKESRHSRFCCLTFTITAPKIVDIERKQAEQKTMQATINHLSNGKTVYVISWDCRGGRRGSRIQNRSVDKEAFEKFVARHNLSPVVRSL